MKLHTLAGLKKARKEEGLTQDQLAKRLNIQVQNVRNWEQGRTLPEYETLFKLMEIFDCDMDYLFGRIECRTHDKQFIHEQTGLSERAIMILQRSATHDLTGIPFDIAAQPLPPDGSAILSSIIESPVFTVLIERIHDLLSLTQQTADGIVNDDTRQQLAERLENALKQSIGLQSKQDLIDIKEYQISRSFIDIVKTLEQEANSNGH